MGSPWAHWPAKAPLGEYDRMFIPHYSSVSSDLAALPTQWLIMMHGIYGRGGNWKTAAREITALRPDWGVLLVDLRMHGRSKGAPRPHTVGACGADVLALIAQQEAEGRTIGMVAGHSFGGKVALSVHEKRPGCPIWLIDSGPGPRPGTLDDPKNTVVSVLTMMEGLPATFASRAAFVEAVQAKGFALPLAQWLGMNLESCSEGYRNALDTSAMRELLGDYFERDLWPAVEASQSCVHVALASRGSSITPGDRERMQTALRVKCYPLEGGHWLHVDALEPLVAHIAASLP